MDKDTISLYLLLLGANLYFINETLLNVGKSQNMEKKLGVDHLLYLQGDPDKSVRQSRPGFTSTAH